MEKPEKIKNIWYHDGMSDYRSKEDIYKDGRCDGYNKALDDMDKWLSENASVEKLLLVISEYHSGNYEEGVKIATAISEYLKME